MELKTVVLYVLMVLSVWVMMTSDPHTDKYYLYESLIIGNAFTLSMPDLKEKSKTVKRRNT